VTQCLNPKSRDCTHPSGSRASCGQGGGDCGAY
jgi:hypothetical protein